jgi:hypothetical protein
MLAAVLLAAPNAEPARKAVQPGPGAAGEWRLIGQTHATRTVDHDAVIVQGPFDNFRKIKFWYETKGLLNGRADVTIFGRK